MRRIQIFIALILPIFLVNCQTKVGQNHRDGIVFLQQGWDADLRHLIYYTPQGSYFIPYDWILHMELPKSKQLLRSSNEMDSLGFIPYSSSDHSMKGNILNPDKLPVGFSKDIDPKGSEWLGFTCAVCHTAQINHKGTKIRIDGGPGGTDIVEFIQLVVKSLVAITEDQAKLSRFAKKVFGDEYTKDQELALLKEVTDQADHYNNLLRINESPHKNGFGRLDAFGYIMNAISVLELGEPSNQKISDAPVSFPFIWGAPKLEWVQWNGSVNNPIRRNIGEVLGTFGHTNLTGPPEKLFQSSVHLKNLFLLEDWINDLTSPKWPGKILGTINQDMAEKGKKLYQDNCKGCHALKPYPLTQPNFYGKQFIKVNMIPLSKVGTDPKMALNVVKREAMIERLAKYLPKPYTGKNVIPTATLVGITTASIFAKAIPELELTEEQVRAYTGYRDLRPKCGAAGALPSPKCSKNGPLPPPNLLAYKARPLEGIWATAPYLHNGSVPSLYQLLLSPEERIKTFHVGSREFDPQNVGFKLEKFQGSFEFRTIVPGNSNSGHKYGTTKLSESEKWELIEFLKTL